MFAEADRNGKADPVAPWMNAAFTNVSLQSDLDGRVSHVEKTHFGR